MQFCCDTNLQTPDTAAALLDCFDHCCPLGMIRAVYHSNCKGTLVDMLHYHMSGGMVQVSRQVALEQCTLDTIKVFLACNTAVTQGSVPDFDA